MQLFPLEGIFDSRESLVERLETLGHGRSKAWNTSVPLGSYGETIKTTIKTRKNGVANDGASDNKTEVPMACVAFVANVGACHVR